MSDKKYELLNYDYIEFGDHDILQRIRALRDIPRHGIKAGDLGGYIQGEDNLSHEGDCWVAENALVINNARVDGNACIRGWAYIDGTARIGGNVRIGGTVIIGGNVRIDGNVHIRGTVIIDGNTRVGRYETTPTGTITEGEHHE